MLSRLLILVIQLKNDYNTKIDEIEKKIPDHGKYIIAQEFNKLRADSFATRLKKSNLASKNDISEFINSFNLDENAEKLATKAELKSEKGKIMKFQTYYSSLFIG